MDKYLTVGKYNIPMKFKKPKHLTYFEHSSQPLAFEKAGELAEESTEGIQEETNFAPQIKPQRTIPNTNQRYYNIENVKNALEVLNENYDTFRTIFKAPDDINVNYEIQQEAAGLIIDLFNPRIISNAKLRQDLSNPIRINKEKESKQSITEINRKLKKAPWYKTYADYRKDFTGQGFDETEYNKHKRNWKQKNIEEFKELFDD